MNRLRKSFENNRSRWAAAASPFATAAVYTGADALGLPPNLAEIAAGAIAASLAAYILGNGYFEGQALRVGVPASSVPGQTTVLPDPSADDVDTNRTAPGSTQ